MIKETLIREYARRNGNLRRREARGLIKIDVNKTSKIWSLLEETGVLVCKGGEQTAVAASSASTNGAALVKQENGSGGGKAGGLSPIPPPPPSSESLVPLPPPSSGGEKMEGVVEGELG
jgi:transcriptional adapter 2-alpha